MIYLKESVDGYRGGLVVDDEPVRDVFRRERRVILGLTRKIAVFDGNLSTETRNRYLSFVQKN